MSDATLKINHIRTLFSEQYRDWAYGVQILIYFRISCHFISDLRYINALARTGTHPDRCLDSQLP